MNSDESENEYGRNIEGDLDIIQNVFSKRNSQLRRVSFPESDTDLVTGYLEPTNPLRLAVNVDKEELLNAYHVSCQRHNTTPLENVIKQIKGFNFDNERSDILKLNNITLTTFDCESLEEIFKRVQFDQIELVDCELTSETAFILFEMFEYYESAIHLIISSNSNLGIRGWQACARYLKKSNTLEKLVMNNIKFSDTEADFLLNPLTFNRYLQVLTLENCNLNTNAIRSLVNALSINITLKELYLVDNNLDKFEAMLLGNLLKNNKCLQVLDLSNNHITDSGLDEIVINLSDQKGYGCLEVLVLWNNSLTSFSASSTTKLLKQCPNLNMLNIGCNDILDSFVFNVKDSLKWNQSLLKLGLQATKLTCASAEAVADVLKTNTVIERIDLRENRILTHGLQFLSTALDKNKTIIQIDLSPAFSDVTDDGYCKFLEEINEKCLRNKLNKSSEILDNDKSKMANLRISSRKISLTCQTLRQEPFIISSCLLSEPKKMSGRLRSPDPSPVPSPVCSPVPMPTKSRFSVSRVFESDCTNTRPSRFTVTIVEPPKSVSPNSSPVVGFDCDSPDSSTFHAVKESQQICTNNSKSSNVNFVESDIISDNNCLNICNSENNCFNICKEDTCNLSPLTESSALLENKLTKTSIVPSDEVKPLTSLEKLLNLFQAPSNLFTKSSNHQSGDKNEICTNKQTFDSFTKQCDSLNCFSFTKANISKTVNMSRLSDCTTNVESSKKNISLDANVSSDQSALNISDFDSEDLHNTGSEDKGTEQEDCSSSVQLSTYSSTGSEDDASSSEQVDSPSADADADTMSRSISDYTNNNKWQSDEKLVAPPGKQNVLLFDGIQIHAGNWRTGGD